MTERIMDTSMMRDIWYRIWVIVSTNSGIPQ